MTNQRKKRWLYPAVISKTYRRPFTSFRTLLLMPCKYERPVVLFSILILMHLVSSTTGAQAKITAIEKNFRPVESTRRITCIRHKTLRREPAKVLMDLEIGDELINSRGVLTVKVNCGRPTDLVLSGTFRVRILRPGNDNAGCNIFYSSSGGELNVRASAPTNIQSGETRLGSRRTLYGIKTIRSKRGLTRQWLVYEGEVSIESPVFSKTVTEGEKLVTKGAAAPSTQTITHQDTQQAAKAYARVEVSQANISNPRDLSRTFLKLQSLHEAVLADPKNEEKRVVLGNEQSRLGIPVPTAKLNRPATQDFLFDLVRQGRHSDAIEGFNRRVNEGLGDSKDFYGLALAHDKTSNADKAIAYAQQALDSNKIDRRLSETEQRDSARMANPKRTNGSNQPTLTDEQAALFQLMNQGKYKEALSGFEQRIREERSNSRDYWGVTLARRKLGPENQLEAIAFARRALDLNAADHRLHDEERVEAEKMAASEQNYLFSLLKRRSDTNAIAGFEKRIREERADSRDYYGLALGFENLKDGLQSVDSALVALVRNERDHRLSREERDDCDRIASLEMAFVLALVGQAKNGEAFERLQRRIREERSDSLDYCVQALLSEQLGKTDQARDYAQQALKLNSTDRRLGQFADCQRMADIVKKTVTQPPAPEKDEQAELFRLIGQRRYNEAIVGFDRRVQDKRENSRDYYGLALTHELLQDAKSSSRNAGLALRMNKNDQLLSEKEQLDCVRMERRAFAGTGGGAIAGAGSEQEKLFRLIKQGDYKDAIAGFQKRVQEKRHDSRDYYGLALCYQGFNDEKQKVAYAELALKLNESEQRLSKEEQGDCRRIASRKEK